LHVQSEVACARVDAVVRAGADEEHRCHGGRCY
jgi:hypothetical protein